MLVVCGKLIEGYDRKQVSVCAIVRNVGSKSKVRILLLLLLLILSNVLMLI